MTEGDEDTANDTVAALLREAADEVLAHVELEGAPVEHITTWLPAGRAVTVVHIVGSCGLDLARMREAFVVAIQQIDALL